MDLERDRVFYEHGPDCTKDNFTELNERGMKTCLDCAGVFDKDGKGLSVTSRRFDANWTPPEEDS